MVLFLFFCSGATALVYEVIWSKYLSLMFGSTVYAQTTVLAVFMGGLALGNRIFGKRSDLLSKPLLAYGFIEVLIGVYALAFTWIYGAADGAFTRIGGGLVHHSGPLLVLKALLSVLLLLGPTVLMGGTLPLLVSWLNRQSGDTGSKSAKFYSVNSLGAVFGSWMAGFFFVHWMGLRSTLEMTALANVIIGGGAILLSRRHESNTATAATSANNPATAASTPSPMQDGLLRRGCLLVACTGAISMGLEILSARSLALLFGASHQAFAVVLISFILGIGIGSAMVASARFEAKRVEGIVFFVLLAAACWIGLGIFNIEPLFESYRHLKSGLGRSDMGYRYQQLLSGLIALVVLGVPAALLGSVLPLWIRKIAQARSDLGNEVGRLLTWNTCGAVVGVMITGFVLMPTIGLRGAFGVMAMVLCAVAFVVTLPTFNIAKGAAVGGVLLFSLLAGFTGGDQWKYIISSGMFRARETEITQPIRNRFANTRILFYEDAPDATVSVEALYPETNRVSLRINGKPDASSWGDLSTQSLLAHIPLAVKPQSKDVFVLGFGSGVTAGALLGHPIENIVVAENCEPVLRAGQFFAPWNNGILTNARAKIRREDARTLLKLEQHNYDVIICEPSNPWTAGVGSIFTQEFYEIAANRLKDGGVVCQWFHTYEMHDGIVSLVLRTFGSVFPHYEVWETQSGDILMLGAKKPFKSDPEVYQEIFKREKPRQDLAVLGIRTPEALWMRQLASQRTAFAIPGEGPVQTDIFPLLEHEAPRAFYLGKHSTMLHKFDERTQQTDLASPQKREAMLKLSVRQIEEVFTNYWSVNNELNEFLQGYFDAHRKKGMDWKNVLKPSIFRPLDAPLPQVGTVKAAEEAVNILSEGHAMVLKGNVLPGLDKIEAALQKDHSFQAHLSLLEYVGANAVRQSMLEGDRARSQRILESCLARNPQSLELNYLRRLLGLPSKTLN